MVGEGLGPQPGRGAGVSRTSKGCCQWDAPSLLLTVPETLWLGTAREPCSVTQSLMSTLNKATDSQSHPQHRSIHAGAMMPSRVQGFPEPHDPRSTHRQVMLHVQGSAGRGHSPILGVWWGQVPLIHTTPKTSFQTAT